MNPLPEHDGPAPNPTLHPHLDALAIAEPDMPLLLYIWFDAFCEVTPQEPDDGPPPTEALLFAETVATAVLRYRAHVETLHAGAADVSFLCGGEAQDILSSLNDEGVEASVRHARARLRRVAPVLWSAWISELRRWEFDGNRVALSAQFWRAIAAVEVILERYWLAWSRWWAESLEVA